MASVNGRPPGIEDVHRRVREAILRGEIAPDAPVSQVRLARQLGVSRTPLREALRMIQREGLVSGTPGRRLRVSPLSVDDLEQLYSLRIWIEALAIRATVPKLTADELATLGALLGEMDELAASRDFDRWDVPHAAFHRGLIQHAGSRFVNLAVELGEHAERYRRVYLSEPLTWSPAATDHLAIFEACRAGEADRASVRLAEHLGRTALAVAAFIDPTFEPTLLRSALRSATGGAPPEPERRRRSAP